MLERKWLWIAVVVVWMGSPALWGKDAAMPQASSPTVHAVEMVGNTAIDAAALQSRLSIKPNKSFDFQQVTFSADVIESIYRDKGYAEVRIRASTEAVADHQVDVRFKITEGPLY